MKKHPRMLKLVTKLMVGHTMTCTDLFADDFAKYRVSKSGLHPALVAAFRRAESLFSVAFKHRHLIEQNHKLHTGIYGNALITMISNMEYEKTKQFHHYPPVSKTLH